jgi:hypothetical protein
VSEAGALEPPIEPLSPAPSSKPSITTLWTEVTCEAMRSFMDLLLYGLANKTNGRVASEKVLAVTALCPTAGAGVKNSRLSMEEPGAPREFSRRKKRDPKLHVPRCVGASPAL